MKRRLQFFQSIFCLEKKSHFSQPSIQYFFTRESTKNTKFYYRPVAKRDDKHQVSGYLWSLKKHDDLNNFTVEILAIES